MAKKITRFTPKNNIDKHPLWNGEQQKQAKEFLEKITNFNNIKKDLDAIFNLEDFGVDREIAEDILIAQIHALKRWNDMRSPVEGTKQPSKQPSKKNVKKNKHKPSKKILKKAKK